MHLINLCSHLILIGLFKHKRTAATHIFVILISTESRTKKPYALLVQCFSYNGLSVKQLREILNKVLHAMVERKMLVNGKVVVCCCVCLNFLKDLLQMENIIQ